MIQQLATKEGNALTVKDKFQSLADNVKLFTAEIDTALEKAAEAIKIDLDRAKTQLDQLNTDLKKYAIYVVIVASLQ